MEIPSLKDWGKRGPLIPHGSHLQEPVEAIREMARQAGLLLGDDEFIAQERWLGTIVDDGPATDSSGTTPGDFTDARYWVKKQAVLGGDPDAVVDLEDDTTESDEGDINPTTVPATNMGEWAPDGGTHSQSTDGTVLVEVFAWWDVGDPQNKRYFFMAFKMPQGTGIYKVLMLIDDLDPGTAAFEYSRFHS